MTFLPAPCNFLDAPVRPAAELEADVRAASLLGRQARYIQLAERLPVLLEEPQAAIWQAADRDRPRLYGLLAEAYGGASAIAHQLDADAAAHLAEARAISAGVPEGANHYGMEFGPANVGLIEVPAAVELADGSPPVTRAERFERGGHLAGLPAVRVGQYRLDVARGWLYHGDGRRALRALQAGRRAAPQLVRVHPMARETVRMIARSEARPNEDSRSFAAWLGIES